MKKLNLRILLLGLVVFSWHLSKNKTDSIIKCQIWNSRAGCGYEIKIFSNHKIYCGYHDGRSVLKEKTKGLSLNTFHKLINLGDKISSLKKDGLKNMPTPSCIVILSGKNFSYTFDFWSHLDDIDKPARNLIEELIKLTPIEIRT